MLRPPLIPDLIISCNINKIYKTINYILDYTTIELLARDTDQSKEDSFPLGDVGRDELLEVDTHL
jgi:hypothetical protein